MMEEHRRVDEGLVEGPQPRSEGRMTHSHTEKQVETGSDPELQPGVDAGVGLSAGVECRYKGQGQLMLAVLRKSCLEGGSLQHLPQEGRRKLTDQLRFQRRVHTGEDEIGSRIVLAKGSFEPDEYGGKGVQFI